MKSKGIVVLLGLTLGLLGAHRFYLGQPVWGAAYIAATTMSVIFLALGIGLISLMMTGAMVLVDIFNFLTMSSYKFDLKYNHGIPGNSSGVDLRGGNK